MIARETAMAALFTHVTGLVAFKSAMRRFDPWDKINDADKPALRWLEDGETNTRTNIAVPTYRILRVKLLVYDFYGDYATTITTMRFNALLESVDGAFAVDKLTNRCDLGLFPQVQDAWIEGDTLKDPGDVDGQAVAVVPVHVLTV